MREVEKLQDEFYKIYKTEDFMMLDRFSKRLDEISESDKSQSIN
jgi:putative GTP pyrophosphokinase